MLAWIATIVFCGTCAAISQDLPKPGKLKENDSFKCEVALVDRKPQSTKILGDFYLLNSEGESETKSFRIPGSTSYINARASVDDEDYIEGITMELGISKKRTGKPSSGSQYAFSLMPGKSIIGRLSLAINISGRRKTVSMICEIPNK